MGARLVMAEAAAAHSVQSDAEATRLRAALQRAEVAAEAAEADATHNLNDEIGKKKKIEATLFTERTLVKREKVSLDTKTHASFERTRTQTRTHTQTRTRTETRTHTERLAQRERELHLLNLSQM